MVVVLREAVAIRDELLEEESILDDTIFSEEVGEGEEEEEKYETPKNKMMLVLRNLQTQVVHVDNDQRD